jgi:hypothetical protein
MEKAPKKRASKKSGKIMSIDATAPVETAIPKPDASYVPVEYAISHAFRGVSYVAVKNSGDPAAAPAILRLKNEDEKEKFILNTVKTGDVLYTDLGGSSDKLALVTVRKGCSVFRIPTFKLGNKERCLEAAGRAGWTVDAEKGIGEETADELTARKVRAMAMLVAVTERIGDYVANRDQDTTLLLVKHKYRSFRAMQKILLANYQRLLATLNDQYLLELANDPDASSGLLSGKKVSAKATIRVIKAMLVDIPEGERAAFIAKLGLDAFEGKKMISRTVVQKTFREIVEALLEAGPMSPFMEAMKENEKAMLKLLKTHVVYQKVFEPLQGCGPRCTARIISSIVDIRRFEDEAALKAYGGYHHFADGSRARRVKGKVSNWNTDLKQGVYQLSQQILKLPDSPWRARLDQRRGYELIKILVARQARATADGMDVEILPAEFAARAFASVNDVSVADLAKLSAHVDKLRERAGVKVQPVEEDESDEVGEAEAEAEVVAKDPKLAKLLAGVKMRSLQKATRWLCQQLLKHFFKAWTACLPDIVKSEAAAEAATVVAA